MSLQSKLPCWDIIQCNKKDACLFGGHQTKACWDLVKADDACSFHICVDCLVYMAKQDNSKLSAAAFSSILEKRKTRGIVNNQCKLIDTLLESSFVKQIPFR